MQFNNQRRLFYWDRGRPARSVPQGAKIFAVDSYQPLSRFALIAGGTPAVPVNEIIGSFPG